MRQAVKREKNGHATVESTGGGGGDRVRSKAVHVEKW